MRIAFFVLLFVCVNGPGGVVAQEVAREPEARIDEPVVVTATKVETPAARLGASVTVITGDDLRTYNYSEVEDALRSVPGVEVQRGGSAGKTASIRIRGANPNQVQVLVDGLRVKSPTLGQFDFSDLSLDLIDRIEILRGPQSTLYGPDAIGGVVHIITRKGASRPEGSVAAEGGSYETFRERAAARGAAGWFNFAVGASRTDSRGQERRFDNDDSSQTSAAARLGLDFPWRGSLSTTGRYALSRTDVPNQGFFPFDLDPDSEQETEFYLFTARYDQQIRPWWTVSGRFGHMTNSQRFEDGPLPPGDFAFTSQVDTRRQEIEALSTWEIARTDTLTLGWERQRESGVSEGFFDESITTHSVFAQNELRLFGRLFIGGGLRYDDNDAFGSELTPRASVVLQIRETGTTLRGAWAEGFRSPTLNDLFFPDTTGGFCPPFGNPDLRPERSRSWEAGADQRLWRNRVRLGFTYFQNRFRDLITVVPIPPFCAQAGNVGRARSRGVETYGEVEPFDWLYITANYTYTDTEDATTGGPLPRVPRHRWHAAVTVTPTPWLAFFVQSYVVSSQFDPLAAPGGGDNPAYYRIDTGGTWTVLRRTGVLDRLDLTLRIQNLTDNSYSEVAGFPALGFSALAGVAAHFR